MRREPAAGILLQTIHGGSDPALAKMASEKDRMWRQRLISMWGGLLVRAGGDQSPGKHKPFRPGGSGGCGVTALRPGAVRGISLSWQESGDGGSTLSPVGGASL